MAETINNNEVILVLKNVINALQDSQKGFADLGEYVKDETLKHFFLAESLKRAAFHGDLESELHCAGVSDIHETGTAGGTLRRVWGDIKTKVIHTDHELLVVAEQGEDAAKAAYADALEQTLPFPIRQLLSDQAAHVLASHNYIRDQRDAPAPVTK
jgi:uncharacterized protein (TIGR02284 family)